MHFQPHGSSIFLEPDQPQRQEFQRFMVQAVVSNQITAAILAMRGWKLLVQGRNLAVTENHSNSMPLSQLGRKMLQCNAWSLPTLFHWFLRRGPVKGQPLHQIVVGKRRWWGHCLGRPALLRQLGNTMCVAVYILHSLFCDHVVLSPSR